jgi:hypothetical protein
MPCLNAHRALASDCCWADAVGAADGVKVGLREIVGEAVGTNVGARVGLLETAGLKDAVGTIEGTGAKLYKIATVAEQLPLP